MARDQRAGRDAGTADEPPRPREQRDGELKIRVHLAAVALGTSLLVATSCLTPGGGGQTTTSPCGAASVTHEQITLDATQSASAGFALEAGTAPVGLVADRDGASVWLLGQGSNRVYHVRRDGTAVRYDLPPSNLGLQLSQAPDGTVWVPEQFRDAVMAIAPDGSVRECTLPRPSSEPVATSVAADGSVWASESRGAAVARLANGRWTEHQIGVAGALGAEVLAARSGGAWLAVNGAPILVRVSASGQTSHVAIPGSGIAIGLLEALDGSVWVADFGGDEVIRVAADGGVTALPAAAGSKPQSLAQAPDASIWFTESGTNHLARVRGTRVEDVYQTGEWPDHMVITADGTAWFTEYYENALGILKLSAC